MKTKIYTIAALFGMLFVTACSKENLKSDVTKPVIELISPQEDATIQIGNAHGVHFEMKLSDDHALKSYKLNIHSNFDGHEHHTHSRASQTVDFKFDKVYDVSGLKNTTVHHHDIVIPENATPGNYHLMVFCTDEAGNEAVVARDIILIK